LGPDLGVQGRLLVGKVPPETKSAMDGARSSCYYQESALVLPEQAGLALSGPFAERVGAAAGRHEPFGRAWQNLEQERVGRIAGSDAGQIGTRDQERQAGGRPFGIGRQGRIQVEQAAEFGRTADRVGQDGLPIGRWPVGVKRRRRDA
jgi:hypothetical protein